jgi:hypothetical protein
MRPESIDGSSERRGASLFIDVEEFHGIARAQKETTMRRGRERRDRRSHHLGTTARGLTQARLACIALTHFQKASTKAAPRHRIVRLQGKSAPEKIGGGRIFAILRQDPCQCGQNIRPLRRIGDRAL